MWAMMATLALGAVDPQLSVWIEEGRAVPDARAGAFLDDVATQVSEFTVMSRVRWLQDALSQRELDEQADGLETIARDTAQPLEVRRRAWFSACHFQRSKTVAGLVAAAQAGPLPLRTVAVMCLGRYGTYNLQFFRELQKGNLRHVDFWPHEDLTAERAAVALVEEKDPVVRDAAWQALSHIESPVLVPLLRRRMKAGESSPAFLRMLGPYRSHETTQYLLRFASSPKVDVRRAAAAMLALRPLKIPRDTLVAFALDPDDAVSTSGLNGLRGVLGLPLTMVQISADRPAMKALIAQRFSPAFKPAPLDKTMPAEVAPLLELRTAGRSAEAASRLESVSQRALAAHDYRTAAIALHRAGDAYNDDHDCNASVDAYWRALSMHELRGDTYFAGVAANDLGLLWFRCTWYLGSRSPELFEYVVRLRRDGADREALRKAVNNYASSLIGLLLLDDAKDVVAESLALAKELKDPVAERKAAINEVFRQARYCTELVAFLARETPDGKSAALPRQCTRREDGSVWFTAEAEVELRAAVAVAVEAARKTGTDNATLCSGLNVPTKFVCDWFPRDR